MKKMIALLLAVSMAVSMTACGGSTAASSAAPAASGTASSASSGGAATAADDLAAKSKYPGTSDADMITINLQQEPPELNSTLTSDTASGVVLRETMSGLMKLDKNDKPIPDLAESYTVSDDKMTYTFKLRKDAKWSNGDPVTAKDYIFAWTTAMKKETASTYSFILTDNIKGGTDYFDGKIKEDGLGIKAPDDYTLVVTLTNPIPYALHLFSFQEYLPLNQKAYEAAGADKYAKDMSAFVTDGAYKMTEWVHNDHITLEQNPDYWDKANVGIPKIKMVMLADANTAMNSLKAGQLDFMTVNGDQLAQFQAEGQPVVTYSDGGNWYVQFNTKKAPFNNAKVRKAFGMAIDKDNFVKNVRKDGSIAATGIVPPATAGANGTKYDDARGDISLKYDKDQAKTLLDEGLKEVGMTKDQLKLVFLSSNSTAAVKDATYMQEQWKTNLGVNVELQPLAFKARVDAMNRNDFDFVYAGWAPDYNDPMTFLDLFTTNNGSNYGKYSSKDYDSLIDQARKEPDPVKRQNLLIKAETLAVQTDAPIFPLYYSVIPYTTSQKFTGGTYSAFQNWPGDYTDGAKLVKK